MTNEPKDPLWRRYRDLLRRRPAADVDEEIRFHLEMREAEALRADWLADLGQDARFALRSLRRAPGFAATAVATLAIAIAANATIFSFVNALLLQPLPYRRPNELVSISGNIIGSIGESLALRERASMLADFALYRTCSLTLSDDLGATRGDGACVTPNLIPMLGVAPMLGRPFVAAASTRGNETVILISHALWLGRYGGDPNIVGRRVDVEGRPYTIVGVMPQRFQFPSTETQFWVPVTIDRADIAATWAVGGHRFLARLAPSVSTERAESVVRSAAIGMRHLNPMWDPGDRYGRDVVVKSLQQSLVATERPALLLLSACVGVVLLVACVNLANLMLARVAAREREFAVRTALGGGRGRLMRQLLTESVMTSGIGAGVGLALAAVGVRWANASLPPDMPRTTDVRLDVVVVAFTAALAMITGVAFGLLPALRAAGGDTANGAAHLARGVGGTARQHRLSSALVVGEVAFAVLLAITAGLLTRSFAQLRDLSPGFRTEHLVAARVNPPRASYTDRARESALYDAILTRASALPGVTSAALVDRLPIAAPVYGMGMRVQGQFEDYTHSLPTASHTQSITPSYLSTLGIPLLRGRPLSVDDRDGAQPVALVSQSLARHFWPNADPIGKRIGYPYKSPWITIVGVVPDVRLDSLRDTASMAVYFPLTQRASFASPEISVVVRTNVDPAVIGRELREAVAGIDRSVPVSDVRTMDDVLSRSVAKPRFTTLLVGGFALAALLLGAIGIYGVMSYVVSQRTQEMGVRVALGATSSDILRLVMGRGAALALLGGAVGCALALIATRGLRSLLYGVSTTDPLTFAAASLAFVAVALLASFAPARRATRVDPVQALREN